MAEPRNLTLLSHRLRRLYAGLSQVGPASIEAVPPRIWRSDKAIAVYQDFKGGESNDEIREALTGIVDKTAHVKDPLKKHVADSGGNPRDIETFIDTSQPLQIIIDVANREKHGYPSDRAGRSGLDPYLGEVGRCLALGTGEGGGRVTYTLDPKTGRPRAITEGSGTAEIVYWGEVWDVNGAVIGDILELARDALADWERLFKSLGITLIG